MTPSSHSGRYELLYELGCAFAGRLDLDELIPLVIGKCRETLAAESASILLRDPETDELYIPYVDTVDPDVGHRLRGLRIPRGCGIAGVVAASGQPLRVDDVASDPHFYPDVDRRTGATTRALLCAPLATGHGIIGVVQVVNPRDGGAFRDDDLRFLAALAGSVAVAIENARLYARVKGSEEQLRVEVGALRRDLARMDRFAEIVSVSAAMQPVFRLMESAATSPITVLVEGETGTGKELVARGIHRAGPRADRPFIAVNCAAIAETLLESELFGHRKGAFTGAVQDRRGVFEAAHGGTIFLDEVGETPAAMQAKLLRVLQEGEITPVGETEPRKVDVRIVAATNRDLAAEVAAGRFRRDLYYRLTAFPIRLPPLRARREDVALLAERCIAAAAGRHGKRIPGIARAALARLEAFDWPGNVRELANEIERAVALCADGEAIGTEHLSPKLLPTNGHHPAPAPEGQPRPPLREARTAWEIDYIRRALTDQGGNVSRAARVLGLSRVMLQKKMRDYGLRG